jgi:hypothetical protein
MEGWTPARAWDEAPPPIPENAPAEGRPQRWGYTERAAIFNMHARVAMLQAIHHGQPEPG